MNTRLSAIHGFHIKLQIATDGPLGRLGIYRERVQHPVEQEGGLWVPSEEVKSNRHNISSASLYAYGVMQRKYCLCRLIFLKWVYTIRI